MAAIVGSSRFKILPVPRRCSIKEFTQSEGFDFAPGRGFYQLTKPETIQTYKEIVAVSISDGTKVSGHRVREILKIPESAGKFKLSTEILNEFKIFVQSTSYNRILLPDTEFLYEVDPDASDASGSGELSDAPVPPSGEGMPIEIAFSFDTTGSMSSCITQVRDKLQQIITRLQADIPNIRVAVFAHGDYCDKSSYITKHIDFTDDVTALCRFVRDASGTGGGDWEECYELVLREAREKLSWTPGTQRALVMIGDAIPHPASHYRGYIKKPFIDHKVETDKIVRELGCRIYSIQCNVNPTATPFWKFMAKHTHGHHLRLDNFSSVVDFIMAICYREQGAEQLEAYRQEVVSRLSSEGIGEMTSELRNLFSSLTSGGSVPGSPPADTGASTARPGPSSASGPSGGTKRKLPTSSRGASASRPAKVAKTTKAPVKKAPVRKAPAKKAPAKKAPAKKAPAKKAPAKKVPAKKAPAKKAPAKKAPAKKAPAKKAPAKKAPAKKAPAKKAPAKKAPAKKAPAKKAPAKRAPAKRAPAKKVAPTKRKGPTRKR